MNAAELNQVLTGKGYTVVKENETGWLFKAGDLESAVGMVLQRSRDLPALQKIGQAARAYIARERQWRNNILALVDFRTQVKDN